MFKINRAFGSVAFAAVLAAGLAMAEGLPGLGAPAAPAAVAPAGGTVELQVAKNGEDGYQIGYPNGWGIVTGGSSDFTFGPTDGSAAGFCFANGSANTELPPNDQLKPIISAPMGEANWKSFMFDGLADLKFVSTGVDVNHPGGWPVQTAVVEATIDQPVTIAALITLKSKTVYSIGCVFARADFPKIEPTLGAVFNSFKVFKE